MAGRRSAWSCGHCITTGGKLTTPIRELTREIFLAQVRSRFQETCRRIKGYKPRRGVVEVAHSWFNRFRKLLVRYEKTHRAYRGLNMFAAAIICFRKVTDNL